jgi:hypothetical protein
MSGQTTLRAQADQVRQRLAPTDAMNRWVVGVLGADLRRRPVDPIVAQHRGPRQRAIDVAQQLLGTTTGEASELKNALEAVTTVATDTTKISATDTAHSDLAGRMATLEQLIAREYGQRVANATPELDAAAAAEPRALVAKEAQKRVAGARARMMAAGELALFSEGLGALADAQAAAKEQTEFSARYTRACRDADAAIELRKNAGCLDQDTLEEEQRVRMARVVLNTANFGDDLSVKGGQAAIAELRAATGRLNAAIGAELPVRNAGLTQLGRFDDRYRAAIGRHKPNESLREMGFSAVESYAAFAGARKALNSVLTEGQTSEISNAVAVVEQSLTAVENFVPPTPDQRRDASTAAAQEVGGLDDGKLEKLDLKKKAALVFDLMAGGKPSGDAGRQLDRLYQRMDLGKIYAAMQGRSLKQTVTSAIGTEKMEAARTNWPSLGDDRKLQFASDIHVEQCKVLGIDNPATVEMMQEQSTNLPAGYREGGSFVPGSNKLFIGTGTLSDFDRVLNVVVHETTHAHQFKLVTDLFSGNIGPDDPKYSQTLAFAANSLPDAYVKAETNHALYRVQPMESDAYSQGDKGQVQMLGGLDQQRVEFTKQLAVWRPELNLLAKLYPVSEYMKDELDQLRSGLAEMEASAQAGNYATAGRLLKAAREAATDLRAERDRWRAELDGELKRFDIVAKAARLLVAKADGPTLLGQVLDNAENAAAAARHLAQGNDPASNDPLGELGRWVDILEKAIAKPAMTDAATQIFAENREAGLAAADTALAGLDRAPVYDAKTLARVDALRTAREAVVVLGDAADPGQQGLLAVTRLQAAAGSFQSAYDAERAVRDNFEQKSRPVVLRCVAVDRNLQNVPAPSLGLALIRARAELYAALDGWAAAKTGESRELPKALWIVEQKINALEKLAPPTQAQKGQAVAASIEKLEAMSDGELDKLPLKDKAEIAYDLCAKGSPDSEARKQLHRLYQHMELDKIYSGEQELLSQETGKKLAELDDVQDVRANWDKLDNGKRMKFLQGVHDTQSRVLGIEPAKLLTTSQGRGSKDGAVNAIGYMKTSNDIIVNTHKDARQDLGSTIAMVLQNTIHRKQAALVGRLLAGRLAEDDPDYPQALAFATSLMPFLDTTTGMSGDAFDAQPTRQDAVRAATDGMNSLMRFAGGRGASSQGENVAPSGASEPKGKTREATASSVAPDAAAGVGVGGAARAPREKEKIPDPTRRNVGGADESSNGNNNASSSSSSRRDPRNASGPRLGNARERSRERE